MTMLDIVFGLAVLGGVFCVAMMVWVWRDSHYD